MHEPTRLPRTRRGPASPRSADPSAAVPRPNTTPAALPPRPQADVDELPSRKAVYTIIEQGRGSRRWVRIGIAYVNPDDSLNVLLDALPVNGTLHIRDFPLPEAALNDAA